jgi:hypothetical protein
VTNAELLTLAVVAVSMAVGVLFGMRILKRANYASPRRSFRGIAIVGALMAAALGGGILISTGGERPDTVTILMGIALWLIAMVVAFRRPKQA